MGVLDDAIREHLELKRKHGASEGEVERQEREALGAPQREPVEQPAGASAAEAPAEAVAPEPAAAVDEPAPVADEPAAAESEPEAGASDGGVAAPEPDVRDADPEVVEAEVVEPEPEAVEPEPAADYEAEPETAPPAEDELDADFDFAPEPPSRGDTPPRGFEPVEDEPAPGEDGEHDVLEDTPDFLEETPEHDRLWFEQKPPRDFDFDDDK